MKLVGLLSILSRAFSGFSLKKLINSNDNLKYTLIGDVRKTITNTITASTFIGTAGNRTFISLIVDKYGSINAFCDTLEVIVSTALLSVTSFVAVATASTGGTAAIVMTVINYIIGLYTPGMISSVIAFVCGATGLVYSSANMSIRWFKGWGTNLYFNK